MFAGVRESTLVSPLCSVRGDLGRIFFLSPLYVVLWQRAGVSYARLLYILKYVLANCTIFNYVAMPTKVLLLLRYPQPYIPPRNGCK